MRHGSIVALIVGIGLLALSACGGGRGPAQSPSEIPGNMDALALEILRLVNIEREKVGAPPLSLSKQLNESAQFHAKFMAENECLKHNCPNEPQMGDRIRNTGYKPSRWGENMYWGRPDPASAMKWWMNSKGHRKNILNPDFEELGVSYVFVDQDGGEVRWRHYWVQNFGSR